MVPLGGRVSGDCSSVSGYPNTSPIFPQMVKVIPFAVSAVLGFTEGLPTGSFLPTPARTSPIDDTLERDYSIESNIPPQGLASRMSGYFNSGIAFSASGRVSGVV
jgi:hypothetical protein